MKKLLSDEFDVHDKTLEVVCRKFKFKAMPSWQHKWFYRFLQISLSFRYAHNCETSINEGLPTSKNYKEFIPDYDLVKFVKDSFVDVWNIEFVRWWGVFGQMQFSLNNEIKFQELGAIGFGKKYTENEKKVLYEKYLINLDKVFNTPSFPDYLILGVPLNKSKNKLLEEFEKVIELYTLFPQEETAHGNFFIKKSKLKESALRDCYRTLEIRMRYPEISLIELAKRSGTLKTSLAGIKDDANNDFANTVRVGIKKQLNMAINIAENSARGLFPDTRKLNGLHSLYLKLHQFPDIGSDDPGGLIFDQVLKPGKYKSQKASEILKELPNLIDSAEEFNFDKLHRSY